ncbi:MAG: hypothetical protein Q9227_000961 [Pyrenula ochraceoflavens]
MEVIIVVLARHDKSYHSFIAGPREQGESIMCQEQILLFSCKSVRYHYCLVGVAECDSKPTSRKCKNHRRTQRSTVTDALCPECAEKYGGCGEEAYQRWKRDPNKSEGTRRRQHLENIYQRSYETADEFRARLDRVQQRHEWLFDLADSWFEEIMTPAERNEKEGKARQQLRDDDEMESRLYLQELHRKTMSQLQKDPVIDIPEEDESDLEMDSDPEAEAVEHKGESVSPEASMPEVQPQSLTVPVADPEEKAKKLQGLPPVLPDVAEPQRLFPSTDVRSLAYRGTEIRPELIDTAIDQAVRYLFRNQLVPFANIPGPASMVSDEAKPLSMAELASEIRERLRR